MQRRNITKREQLAAKVAARKESGDKPPAAAAVAGAAASSEASETVPAEAIGVSDSVTDKGDAAPTSSKDTPLSLALKLGMFFSIVPIMFFVPYSVEFIVDATRDKMDYLQPIWAIEALFVVVLYFIKDKHTNDSFFTQLCTWALFALGSYAIVGVFNFLDQTDRMVILKLWATVTFVPYAVIAYYDDFDYVAKEKQEEADKKKEEERNKRRDEKIKKARAERKRQLKQLQLETTE